MPRVVKPKQNLVLADALETWANKFGQGRDAYVSGLIQGLRENKNLEVWSTLSPLDYLPIPEVKTGSKMLARIRFFIVLRNVLVFAPVALTWIAVGEATTGFAEYINSNTAGVVNFLDFWQNGYDILGPEFRISHVALLDAIIILAVIALTLLTSVLGSRATSSKEKAETAADQERMAIALEISKYLYTRRAVTNATLNQAVLASINKLLNATSALETTTRVLEKATKEARAEKIEKRQSKGSQFEDFTYEPPKRKKSKPAEFTFNFDSLDLSPEKKSTKWPWRAKS
ncbi:MAG: hypothetical protein QNK54_03690 [Candidatus Planktophila sp.]